MIFKLKSLSITNYDSQIMDNVKFLKEIEKDEEINRNMDDAPLALERSNGVTNLRLGLAYLVKDKDSVIGLIRLAKPNAQVHDISIDIAIRPIYRHKGYGTILLKEVSDYIFRNSTLIKKIKLSIDSSNVNGVRCAASANFTLDGYVNYPNSKPQLLYSKHK